jgi:hypothetical protein
MFLSFQYRIKDYSGMFPYRYPKRGTPECRNPEGLSTKAKVPEPTVRYRGSGMFLFTARQQSVKDSPRAKRQDELSRSTLTKALAPKQKMTSKVQAEVIFP